MPLARRQCLLRDSGISTSGRRNLIFVLLMIVQPSGGECLFPTSVERWLLWVDFSRDKMVSTTGCDWIDRCVAFFLVPRLRRRPSSDICAAAVASALVDLSISEDLWNCLSLGNYQRRTKQDDWIECVCVYLLNGLRCLCMCVWRKPWDLPILIYFVWKFRKNTSMAVLRKTRPWGNPRVSK